MKRASVILLFALCLAQGAVKVGVFPAEVKRSFTVRQGLARRPCALRGGRRRACLRRDIQGACDLRGRVVESRPAVRGPCSGGVRRRRRHAVLHLRRLGPAARDGALAERVGALPQGEVRSIAANGIRDLPRHRPRPFPIRGRQVRRAKSRCARHPPGRGVARRRGRRGGGRGSVRRQAARSSVSFRATAIGAGRSVDARGVAYDSAGRLWFASPQGVGRSRCRRVAPAHRSRGPSRGRLHDRRRGRTRHRLVRDTPRRDPLRRQDVGVPPGTALAPARRRPRHRRNAPRRRVVRHGQGRRCHRAQAHDARRKGQILRGRDRPVPSPHRVRLRDGRDACATPGDKSQTQQHDSDNDGLWTSMYGAGECFAYGATKDPLAKQRAKKAFEALKFLSVVTQGGEHPAPRGFPARAILPTSGPDPNVRDSRDRDVRRQAAQDRLWKIMSPRWPKSADGKWYWKSDTSSDELDGHYFFYARLLRPRRRDASGERRSPRRSPRHHGPHHRPRIHPCGLRRQAGALGPFRSRNPEFVRVLVWAIAG